LINRLVELHLQKSRERQNIYAHSILTSSLDLEAYRDLAGKIKGLKEAEELLKVTYDSLVNNKDLTK
jgi:hypothetical protein